MIECLKCLTTLTTIQLKASYPLQTIHAEPGVHFVLSCIVQIWLMISRFLPTFLKCSIKQTNIKCSKNTRWVKLLEQSSRWIELICSTNNNNDDDTPFFLVQIESVSVKCSINIGWFWNKLVIGISRWVFFTVSNRVSWLMPLTSVSVLWRWFLRFFLGNSFWKELFDSHFLQGILMPLIGVVGLGGNLLSVAVLSGGNWEPIIFYMKKEWFEYRSVYIWVYKSIYE